MRVSRRISAAKAARVSGAGIGLLLCCALLCRGALAAPRKSQPPLRAEAVSAAGFKTGRTSAAADADDDAGDSASGADAVGRPSRTADRSVHFWLAVARAQPQRDDPARARAAFLRALQREPQNRTAMRGLLWALIEQPDRPALSRALQRFAGAAPHDPQLWRSYAAGLSLLGRYAESLPWFARGAQQPSGDPLPRLWLADWVYALSQSGAEHAAEHRRRLALFELQRAAHGPQAGRADSPYAGLLARTVAQLQRFSFDEEFQADRAARLRPPADAAADTSAPNQDADAAQDAPDEEAPAADSAATESSAAAGDAEDAEDDEADEPTPTAASPPNLQRPPHLISAVLAYELHSLGGLLIHSTLAGVGVTLRQVELGVRLGSSYLDTAGERLGLDDPSLSAGEFDAAAFVRFRPRAGLLEAVAGGNFRRELSIPYAAMRGLYYFGRGVSLHGEVSVNQLTEDTLGLRVFGARDRVLAGLTYEPLRFLYFITELDFHAYFSRRRESLGDGFAAYVETGYRAHRGRLGWDLRASGFYENSRLASDLPEDLCRRLRDRCANTGIDDIVLPTYAMVGAGPRLRYNMPGSASSGGGSGHFFFFMDGWLGALLHSESPGGTPEQTIDQTSDQTSNPSSSPSSGQTLGQTLGQTISVGYDLQLGVGVVLPRSSGRLSASGYLSNSRSGGFEGVQWGAGVRYAR